MKQKQKLESLMRTLALACLLLTAGGIHAQRITQTFNAQPLSTVLKAVEQQTGMSVMIATEHVNKNKPVTATFRNATVDEVMRKVLDNNLTYQIQNKMIVISSKPSQDDKRSKTVAGMVTDENDEPLIGAAVQIKGQEGSGTVTDADGRFTLTVPSNDATLRISSIGYVAREVRVGAKSYLSVRLEDSSKELNEVVVVGYATQKKVNLSGSVASVRADKIENRVENNVLSAIQGVVPGVTVISRPGSTPSINFRGRGNLGTSAPLYVIDGAISDATFFQNLDPNSIESISFLKDAASASIYGSRAAYGVVLVTTKKGSKSRSQITYNGYVGVKSATYIPKSVDAVGYATLRNEGAYNVGLVSGHDVGKYSVYSEEQIAKFANGSDPDNYANTDWMDLCLDKTVMTTSQDINFSGGSETVKYFIGAGFNYDDNFIPEKNDYRYNLTSNISADITKWLTLNSNIKYIRNEGKNGAGLSLSNCISIPAIMTAKQSDGEWGSIAGGAQAPTTWITGNPLRGMSRNNWSNTNYENSMYNLSFDIKPLRGLVITALGSYKRYEYKSKSYVGLLDEVKLFGTGNAISGTGNSTNYMNMSWASNSNLLTQLTARYDITLGKHDFGVLLGTSYERYLYEALSAYRKNFSSDNLTDITGGSEAGQTNDGGSHEYRMKSFFGRINYAFANRYLLELNLRADGSSRFHEDSRWGWFPSVSAAWRISEEPFMRNVDWVRNLKLRASYGTLGSINNVGYYDYFPNYAIGSSYVFDGEVVGSVRESRPANKSLTWEKVSIADIGLDFSILNNRLDLTLDFYDKRTSDILLAYNVALETGISSTPSQNIAKVSNKGLELAATWRDKIGDLHYSIGANLSTNSNEITDMGTSNDLTASGGDAITYIYREGESIGSFYGYKTDGLYTQEEIDRGEYYTFGRKPNAGDIKYVPTREGVKYGDAISSEDRTIIGKDVPTLTYGLNLNLEYKGIELGIFGQGVGGTQVAFETETVWAFDVYYTPRQYMYDNRWTVDNPNPNAAYQRIYGGTTNDKYNWHFNDRCLFDADYFRIKTITLGYNFPANLISSIGLSALKVYATGENLLTWRADKTMKDFDPETASARNIYTLASKSIALGVNVAF